MISNIKSIWIESEENGPILGGIKELNDNSDVIVEFQDGKRFIASFYTYKNIEWLRNKNKKTGECLGGRYFWGSDMILVEKINRTEIEEIIEHLINDDNFEAIFDNITEN